MHPKHINNLSILTELPQIQMETDIVSHEPHHQEEESEHSKSSNEVQDSNNKIEFKAPAPINVQSRQPAIPSVPYEKPEWSGLPKDNYAFEVIKGGISIGTMEIPAKEFLVLGDQLKFGESTRIYILLGPEEPQQQAVKPVPKPTPEMTGVTWGFAEDAEDESEISISAAKESWKRDENAYYYKDPKKALRNWLENRGYEMEFESEQEGPGHARTFTSRDADRQAAIDACEKLDMLGILRASQDEALARKKRLKHLLGDDADDEENDSFYDRTGQADRVKSRKSLQATQKVETYESLIKQREELALRIEEIRNKISTIKMTVSEKSFVSRVEDELENFMNSIEDEIKNESEANLQTKLQDLLTQDQRLDRLIQITKPHDIMKNNNIPPSSTSNGVPKDSREGGVRIEQSEKSIETKEIKNFATKTEEAIKHDMVETTSKLIPSEHEDSAIPSKRVNMQENDDNSSPGGDEEQSKKRKIKPVLPMTPQEFEENQRRAMELNELENEDAITWEPPQGQTGDGRTALNDKFGY
ncbi:10534_t:CDS:10 [Acaulospora colombiana]|uniref:10534_t:CDS:1 n=1 Tax=Acaulospora colombiana TaxID=27376 RepID=A0ACA9K6B7_9GLOM|nr:10534_t:CDS:10 [Acaulospora colombiana]